MKNGSQKRSAVILVLLFLIGAFMFVWPMVSEWASYQADDEEYGTMAEQVRVQETGSEIRPTPAPTETITADPALPDESPDPSGLLPEEPPGTEASETACTETPAPEATALPPVESEPETTPDTPVTEEPTSEPPRNTHGPGTATQRPTDKPAPATPTPKPQSGVDLEACLAQNRDFIAWLTIPGTGIDYPVVRSDNTEYYLHHLFTGKQSKLGTLFSLKSSDYRTPSRNIAIYGHRLSHSDAMFSTLLDYKDPDYYAAHSVIHLDTLYGRRDYRIFAVINMKVTEWDAATASFASDESFMRFVNRARRKALYETGVQVTASDHILTLITCDRGYGGVSGRLIVMAVQE